MQATVEREGRILIVKMPLQQPVRSKSGKTFVVASTHGTITTNARYRNKRIVVTANAFIYPQEKKGSQKRSAHSPQPKNAGKESRD